MSFRLETSYYGKLWFNCKFEYLNELKFNDIILTIATLWE